MRARTSSSVSAVAPCFASSFLAASTRSSGLLPGGKVQAISAVPSPFFLLVLSPRTLVRRCHGFGRSLSLRRFHLRAYPAQRPDFRRRIRISCTGGAPL